MVSILLWEHAALAAFISDFRGRFNGGFFESGHARITISEESNQKAEAARKKHKERVARLKADIHYTLAKNSCWAACMKNKQKICAEESLTMLECIEKGIKIARKKRKERGHTIPK